jgi:hypothetical protein
MVTNAAVISWPRDLVAQVSVRLIGEATATLWSAVPTSPFRSNRSATFERVLGVLHE